MYDLINICVRKSDNQRQRNVINYIIIDLCRNYCIKIKPNVQNKDLTNETYFTCTFISKSINDIGLCKILNAENLTKLYPSETSPSLKLSYKYQPNIRQKILNYSKEVKHYNGETLSCNCRENPFKDPIIGHVVTGDLKIIKIESFVTSLVKVLTTVSLKRVLRVSY